MWKPGSLFDESIEHGDWYDEGLFSDELYHHGIKGMHWGIRRSPEQLGHPSGGGKKKQGILAKHKAKKEAKAAAKAEKQAEQERQNKMFNASHKYSEEYDKTSEGKKLKAEYDKVIDTIFNDYESIADDQGEVLPEFNKKFVEVEERYLRGSMRAEAQGLRKEFGDEEFKAFADDWTGKKSKNADEAQKNYEDRYWVHAM